MNNLNLLDVYINPDEIRRNSDFIVDIPYKSMCKIEGPTIRHLEQLWDEVKKLKERVTELEKSK